MNTTKGRGIELATLVASPDVETHLGRIDDGYQSISLIEPKPASFLLTLRDSSGRVTWEPSGEEMAAAGEVFGRVLERLYDGRRSRLCLELDEAWMGTGLRAVTSDTYLSAGKRAAKRGLSPAFLWRGNDVHGTEWERKYWWCFKSVLPRVFRASWSPHGVSGFLVPRSVTRDIHSELDAGHARKTLIGLVSSCLLIFECVGHGSQMLVLSRSMTLRDIERAALHGSVRIALRKLSRSASFGQWQATDTGEGRTAYRKDGSSRWWREEPS